MDIVINCLGMPFDGDTIKNRSLGGSETAAYYVAKGLAEQGHNVTLFTRTDEQKTFDNVKYVPAGEQSEQYPMGQQFHYYAENTPHDILIIQRSPMAFSRTYASKVNLWWLHDLAMYRNRELNNQHLWNVDGVLVVSEYHKEQVNEVYGIDKDFIHVLRNGIDLELFRGELEEVPKQDGIKYLLYTSRPERGLEHLVAPGGIMEELLDEPYHLLVCAYDNKVSHMADYYEYLNYRIEQLPNVSNMGSLTKKQLADLMRQVDLHVYPTPGPGATEFREVSCITVMECMAAGLPMLTSDAGALAETSEGGGVKLLPLNDKGMPGVDEFVEGIKDMLEKPNLSHRQLECAPSKSWSHSVDALIDLCRQKLSKKSNISLKRHFLDMSDLPAFDMIQDGYSLVDHNISVERDTCYEFYDKGNYDEHYAKLYAWLEDQGVVFGPEDINGNLRFEAVARIVGDLPEGSTVLDYGCAHGHYTVNLAKRYPNITFTGMDICQSNVDKANAWAKEEGLTNISFICNFLTDDSPSQDFDCILACEVVEHVGNYVSFLNNICRQVKTGGRVVITTPFGPWEAINYRKEWPWRCHLHHFDRKDVKEILGDFEDLNIVVAPSGQHDATPIGSYIYDFTTKDEYTIHQSDYTRKIAEAMPRQTVSLCMIARNAEATIQQAIDSVSDVVQEVVVSIDETTTDGTEDVIQRLSGKYPDIAFNVLRNPSPLEIGFDEARNRSIKEASCDWVLWLDSDEKVVDQRAIHKYLRNNEYLGYGIAQHHYAVEPLGVMKTDFPIRLFRNHMNIKFFGVVHEHPEIKLNEHIGRAHIIGDVEIIHTGYLTEEIRRNRFKRNIDLMKRDREKYPERTLGKYLWIRDMAQMTKYELEGGHCPKEVMKERSDHANELWRELVEAGEIRMVVDSMDYYSFLNVCADRGVKATFKCDFDKHDDPTLADKKEIGGRFASNDDVSFLFNKIMSDKTKLYDSPWY